MPFRIEDYRIRARVVLEEVFRELFETGGCRAYRQLPGYWHGILAIALRCHRTSIVTDSVRGPCDVITLSGFTSGVLSSEAIHMDHAIRAWIRQRPVAFLPADAVKVGHSECASVNDGAN